MLQVARNYPRAFVLAVIVHLVLLGLMIYSLGWTIRPPAGGATPPPLEAVVIDESRVNAEQRRLDELEQRELAEQQRLQREAEQARQVREQEQQRLEELRRQAKVEEKRIAQQRLEQERLEQQRVLEQRKAEALALEKKREQEAEAVRRKVIEQEARRKAEQAGAEAAKKKAAEEAARRKAEQVAAAKRKAEKAAAAAAKRKAEQAAAQQASRRELEAEQTRAVVAEYTGLIRNKVERNWIRPSASREGMSCVVSVSLMPGGDVAAVRIERSSGDPAFDRSVENAVYRASPMPLPDDRAMFDHFRTLNFVFEPR